MTEIVVISGKGGTGKTSLTAAFAHLANNAVLCDLDVDAPDLHILLDPRHRRVEEFCSGHKAAIAADRCEGCGLCQELCRFGAVSRDGDSYSIDQLRCEGCKVCVALCPAQAIDFNENHCGSWYVSDTRFGPMVHAQLIAGEENSGRLVSLIRKEARALAAGIGAEMILCDGAPGIGCPVISSLSGADMAVIVTEPTPSGLHDLKRVADLCGHFKVRAAVVVNKQDLNPAMAGEIARYCEAKGMSLVAGLDHDPGVTKAMLERKAMTEYDPDHFGRILVPAWERILGLAQEATRAKALNL